MDLLQILLYLICRATWFYSYLFLLTVTLYIPIVLAYSCSRLGTKIHYLLWKLVILYPVLLLPGLFLPFLLVRPRSVMNARFTSWFLRKVSYITNTTWELRGANIAGMDQGAVICCNHQSAVDIFGKQVYDICAKTTFGSTFTLSYLIFLTTFIITKYLLQRNLIYGRRLNS